LSRDLLKNHAVNCARQRMKVGIADAFSACVVAT